MKVLAAASQQPRFPFRGVRSSGPHEAHQESCFASERHEFVIHSNARSRDAPDLTALDAPRGYAEHRLMADLSEYERSALSEIEAWKNAPEGVVARAISTVASTAPAKWLMEHAPSVPDTIKRPVTTAVQGFLELLKDGAYWTYSDSTILARAQEQGLPVQTLPELAEQPLEGLDQLARTFFAENKIIAALEGGGTGLGGFVLIAADIPALFTVAFRTIQQIGASYGFDMRDPNMAPVVLGIVGVASGAEEAAKIAALTDMQLTARMFAKNWTYKKVAERTMAGGPAQALKQFAERLPREIANSVTKRKLAQAIPLAGAAVGAGFNYWFIASTARTAYMTFRELYLARKQARLGDGEEGPVVG